VLGLAGGQSTKGSWQRWVCTAAWQGSRAIVSGEASGATTLGETASTTTDSDAIDVEQSEGFHGRTSEGALVGT
jgi:hypothetical protein